MLCRVKGGVGGGVTSPHVCTHAPHTTATHEGDANEEHDRVARGEDKRVAENAVGGAIRHITDAHGLEGRVVKRARGLAPVLQDVEQREVHGLRAQDDVGEVLRVESRAEREDHEVVPPPRQQLKRDARHLEAL